MTYRRIPTIPTTPYPAPQIHLQVGQTSATAAVANSQYFSFTLSKQVGQFTPLRIEFFAYATIVGRNYFVRTSADNYATDLVAAAAGSTAALVSITLTGSQYVNLNTFTVRIYGWGTVVPSSIYFTDVKVFTNTGAGGTMAPTIAPTIAPTQAPTFEVRTGPAA